LKLLVQLQAYGKADVSFQILLTHLCGKLGTTDVAKGNYEIPRNPNPDGNNRKIIVLKDGVVEKRFQSGRAACDFLGVARNACRIAIKKGKPIKGWSVEYGEMPGNVCPGALPGP
jgi:hypothetical protein